MFLSNTPLTFKVLEMLGLKDKYFKIYSWNEVKKDILDSIEREIIINPSEDQVIEYRVTSSLSGLGENESMDINLIPLDSDNSNHEAPDSVRAFAI